MKLNKLLIVGVAMLFSVAIFTGCPSSADDETTDTSTDSGTDTSTTDTDSTDTGNSGETTTNDNILYSKTNETLTLDSNSWTNSDTGATEYNQSGLFSILSDSYQAKAGDVLDVVMKGTSSSDITGGLKAIIVDNGKDTVTQYATTYGWIVLSGYEVVTSETVTANTEFTWEFKITITTDSTAAGNTYNKFDIMSGTSSSTLSAVTLTLSEFTITKE